MYDDYDDFAYNSMRIRQAFDFTGRTGTLVFDVDAKVNPLNGGHGWWVEVWLTDDPAPMPFGQAPGVFSIPRNGVRFNFQGLNSCNQGRNATQISAVAVYKDYALLHDYPGWTLKFDSDDARCFLTADAKLNRFKFLISQSQAEIWVSDAGSTLQHRIATVPALDLPFSVAFIHLEHVQFNAYGDGMVTPSQTYRWDNLGFDGPTAPVPRVYPIADNRGADGDGMGGVEFGYPLAVPNPTTLAFAGVDTSHASRATWTFTIEAEIGDTLHYNFNGGTTHDFIIPAPDASGLNGLRGFALDVPLAELRPGSNAVSFSLEGPQITQGDAIANLEVEVQ